MKKKTKVEKEVPLEETTIEVKSFSDITPLTGDFGRQDLNELRDKVNEIISFFKFD